MKKIICLVVVGLMIAGVAIAANKIVITQKNLPSLKGTWEGILTFGAMEMGTSPAKLEILNDSVPVKARLTVVKVPDQLAAMFATTGGLKVLEADDGTITSQGTLFWTGPQKNFVEVSLIGEKKISVWYYYMGMRGDATLKKK